MIDDAIYYDQDDEEQSFLDEDYPPSQPLDFSAERYRREIEDFELTPEQQSDLLRTLWDIMCGFNDLGFEGAALSQILPSLLEDAWDEVELDIESDEGLGAIVDGSAEASEVTNEED